MTPRPWRVNHVDRAIALYYPASSAGHAIWLETRVYQFCLFDRWPCGGLAIPRSASQTHHALKDARCIGQAATLMYAPFLTSMTCLALRRRGDDEGGDN
jgi:hypothetical protein